MIMTHAHAEGQGVKDHSVQKKDRVETDARAEAIALPDSLTRSVIKHHHHHYHVFITAYDKMHMPHMKLIKF